MTSDIAFCTETCGDKTLATFDVLMVLQSDHMLLIAIKDVLAIKECKSEFLA